MSLPSETGNLVIDSESVVFRNNKKWADKAIGQLPDDKLRVPLDGNTNSIAVIMKHTAGNLLSRWTDFLTSDGEKDWRNRDDEFVDAFSNRQEIVDYWEEGWSCLFATLAGLNSSDLAKTVAIRGEPHTVALAIHRSLSHCAYHCGQIIMVARVLAGDDWETITIPRGASSKFNATKWGQNIYR